MQDSEVSVRQIERLRQVAFPYYKYLKHPQESVVQNIIYLLYQSLY